MGVFGYCSLKRHFVDNVHSQPYHFSVDLSRARNNLAAVEADVYGEARSHDEHL